MCIVVIHDVLFKYSGNVEKAVCICSRPEECFMAKDGLWRCGSTSQTLPGPTNISCMSSWMLNLFTRPLWIYFWTTFEFDILHVVPSFYPIFSHRNFTYFTNVIDITIFVENFNRKISLHPIRFDIKIYVLTPYIKHIFIQK